MEVGYLRASYGSQHELLVFIAMLPVYDGSWTEWAEKEKDKGGDALIDKGV